MAFDFGDLLSGGLAVGSGLLGTAVGGPLGSAAGTLLPGLFRAGMSAFGLSDDSSTTSNAMNQGLDALKQTQQIASYTQSGQEGVNANREAFNKSRELVNTRSAESMLNEAIQRNLGGQALGSAQKQMDTASTMAQRNLGNQRTAMSQIAGRMGANPAALAGLAGQLGAGNTQTLMGLQGQSGQMMQQGLGQAGQMFGQADQGRMADLQSRLQMFQPFALQKFGGTNLGAMGGLGSLQESQSRVNAAEDPMDLLKYLSGNVAGTNYGNMNLDLRAQPTQSMGYGYSQQSPMIDPFWSQQYKPTL